MNAEAKVVVLEDEVRKKEIIIQEKQKINENLRAGKIKLNDDLIESYKMISNLRNQSVNKLLL